MSSIAVSIIVAIAAIVGYISYQAVGPDNRLEQTCEAVIKAETGENVDLSPNEKAESKQASEMMVAAPNIPVLPGSNGGNQS